MTGVQTEITYPDTYLRYENGPTISFLVYQYRSGDIEKPPHQREIVWSEEHKKNWIARLNGEVPPTGVIVTYQTKENPRKTYLNDGWQRLSTCIDYLDNPEKYGHTEEHAKHILSKAVLPVQHRVYPTQDAAVEDFQNLNGGTLLTPYEFYHGILTCMHSYDLTWLPFLTELNRTVLSIGRSILSSGSISAAMRTARNTRHKWFRDDYALFLRFVSRSSAMTSYEDVSIGTPTPNRSNLVEHKLRRWLESAGKDKAEQEFAKFSKTVARETRIIEKALREAIEENGSIVMGMYRWLLHFSIWKRHSQMPNSDWMVFIMGILKCSGGGTSIQDLSDPRIKSNIRLGRIGRRLEICRIIGFDPEKLRPRPRKYNKTPLPGEGIDRSHKEPFSTHGDGEVILEPASINRARGARSIEVKTDD